MSDGLEVRLLWNREANRVFVAVEEDGTSFMFDVAAENALDAFQHPYAYAPEHQDSALAA